MANGDRVVLKGANSEMKLNKERMKKKNTTTTVTTPSPPSKLSYYIFATAH